MKLFALITAIAMAPVAAMEPAGAAITYALILFVGTLLPDDRPSRWMSRQTVSGVEVRVHCPARPSQRASVSMRAASTRSHNHGSKL